MPIDHEKPLAAVVKMGWTAAGLTVLGLGAEVIGQGAGQVWSGFGWLGVTWLSAALFTWMLLGARTRRLGSTLAQNRLAYLSLFESHPQPVLLVDAITLDIVEVNPAAGEKYGYSREELAGMSALNLHREEGREDSRSDWAPRAASARKSPGATHMTKNGTTFLVELASSRFERAGRRLWMTVVTETTERDDALAGARLSDTRYHQMAETAKEAILTVDLDMAISEANPAAGDLLGYSTEELTGRPVSEFYGPGQAEVAATQVRERAEGRLEGEREMTLRDKDGVVLPVLVNESPLLDRQGDYAGQLGMITDLTERKGFEDELSFQALHDPLTGLANRLLLADRLQLALGRATGDAARVAAIFVDVDEFKKLNAEYGHAAGDALLVEIAARLSASVAERATVARFGANEFVIVCEGNEAFADRLVETLRTALKGSFDLGSAQIDFTVSMGVGLGGNGERPGILLRNADTALMLAKANGRNRTEMFTDALGISSRQRLAIVSELRRALPRGEFSLRFQPVVSLPKGAIIGAEALLRWEHPRRGTLSPSEFISVAEESGLIVGIGKWVIEETTRHLARWQTLAPELSVSLNISARQLMAGGLDDIVRQAVSTSGADSTRLALEITESVLMDDVDHSCEVLNALRRTGVTISIDDFGTGYSSLSYLNRFPIDVLKIDQSFVAGLPDNAYDAALVQAVMAIATALNLSVTAEGVEAQAQANSLASLGCTQAQGYHFYRPMPPEAFEVALRADQAGRDQWT